MSVPREQNDMDDEENETKSKVQTEKVKSQIEWAQSRIAQMNEAIQVMEGVQKKNTTAEAQADFEIKTLEDEIKAVEICLGAMPDDDSELSDFLHDILTFERVLERVDSMDAEGMADSSEGSDGTNASSEGGCVRELSPD